MFLPWLFLIFFSDQTNSTADWKLHVSQLYQTSCGICHRLFGGVCTPKCCWITVRYANFSEISVNGTNPCIFLFKLHRVWLCFQVIPSPLSLQWKEISLILSLIRSILNIQLVLYLNHLIIQFKFWTSKLHFTCELVKALVIIWVEHFSCLDCNES